MPIRTPNSPDRPPQQLPPAVAAEVPPKPEEGNRSVRARLRRQSAEQRHPPETDAADPGTWSEAFRIWQRKLRDWATGPEGVSVVISVAVHVVLFLGLILVLYVVGRQIKDHPGERGPINAVFTERNVDTQPETFSDLEFDLDEALSGDASLNSAAVNDNSRFAPDMTLSKVTDTSTLLSAIPEAKTAATDEDDGEENKSWKRTGFPMPKNKGKVVTQGSFSVWTVPEDPQPRQSYRIIIQLSPRVPIRDLRTDVTGSVAGTDGYRASIGHVQPGYHYPRQLSIPKAHQIAIEIPPAKRELVRDVIDVHSKTLNESQRIEIEF